MQETLEIQVTFLGLEDPLEKVMATHSSILSWRILWTEETSGYSPQCVRAQSCPTLCNPMDCSLPGSSVYRIFQARILELFAISYSRESSQPKDQTHISCVSCIGRWILYHCATWEAQLWNNHHSVYLSCRESSGLQRVRHDWINLAHMHNANYYI